MAIYFSSGEIEYSTERRKNMSYVGYLRREMVYGNRFSVLLLAEQADCIITVTNPLKFSSVIH